MKEGELVRDEMRDRRKREAKNEGERTNKNKRKRKRLSRREELAMINKTSITEEINARKK